MKLRPSCFRDHPVHIYNAVCAAEEKINGKLRRGETKLLHAVKKKTVCCLFAALCICRYVGIRVYIYVRCSYRCALLILFFKQYARQRINIYIYIVHFISERSFQSFSSVQQYNARTMYIIYINIQVITHYK